MRTSSLFFLTALIASPALAQEMPPLAPPPSTLQVTAMTEARGTPDIAIINTGVMTLGATAAEALSKNGTQMNAVFAALRKAGVEARDMQTSGINVNPQMDYRENQTPRVTGYQANNSVTVTVRKLDDLGSIIDTLAAQGANQISGPTFSIDNPEPLLDKARAEAVIRARARADLYARAAGVTIKRILNIAEVAAPGPLPMPMMRGMAMEASSTPVAPGQVNLSVTVMVTFELAQ